MEKIKRALEAVQHIYLCEDEGMASGQPTKEDYLEARKLVAAALSELEGSKPKEPPRYVMIKDRYGELYELLCKGGEALGYVSTGHPSFRTGCSIRRSDHGGILYHIGHSVAHSEELFKSECTRLNLEWIAVEPPKEQGAEPVGRKCEGRLPMNRFRYMVLMSGGIGPDVWDKEIAIEANDLLQAASVAHAAACECGGWVVHIEQDDELKTTDVSAPLVTAPTSREKAMEEAGDAMAARLKAISTGDGLRAVWRAAKSTK